MNNNVKKINSSKIHFIFLKGQFSQFYFLSIQIFFLSITSILWCTDTSTWVTYPCPTRIVSDTSGYFNDTYQ